MLKKKTLSRILALALALISVGSLIVPAMASEVPANTYNINNYFTEQIPSDSGDMVSDYYTLYRSWVGDDFQWHSGYNGSGSSFRAGSGSAKGDSTTRVAFSDGTYFFDGFIKVYGSGRNLYYLGDLPDYGAYYLTSDISVSVYKGPTGSTSLSTSVPVSLGIECYDASKNRILDAVFDQRYVSSSTNLSFETILVLPAGTAYICPYFYFTVNKASQFGAVSPLINSYRYIFKLRHSYSIVDENNPVETLPPESGSDGSMDEIKDAIANQGKQEQDAADSQGNASLDELTGAVPDESQGFMDAIKSLVGAMSYNGTDAQLTIPAVTIPGIPGVMSGYTLMGSNKIDFGYWVQKMPSNIITLVQALLTLALIGYCFKELYSLISYLFTLKGAGSD